MKIYVTSDTHLNHKKLIEWGRPEDFEERILKSHAALEPGDCLIHLGDFCIGKDAEMHEKWFEATKHLKNQMLVRGNHDKKSMNWYVEHGWPAVTDYLAINLYGERVLFTHIPVDPRRWPEIDINVHGHTHGNGHRDHEVAHLLHKTFHREVAMELTGYKPILLTEKFIKGA